MSYHELLTAGLTVPQLQAMVDARNKRIDDLVEVVCQQDAKLQAQSAEIASLTARVSELEDENNEVRAVIQSLVELIDGWEMTAAIDINLRHRAYKIVKPR